MVVYSIKDNNSGELFTYIDGMKGSFLHYVMSPDKDAIEEVLNELDDMNRYVLITLEFTFPESEK